MQIILLIALCHSILKGWYVMSVEFISQGDHCVADLYLPKGVSLPPVIVMAHGFAGERKARLPVYAQRFCDAGYAVFLFDYRGFGDSEGIPRQLVSPWRQLDDWRAAIAHVRTLNNVDTKRLILWGTSFAGGHVISIASEDHNIHAIISQVPFTSGVNLALQNSLVEMLHMTWAGIKDSVRALIGATPHPYPVVARPGQPAVMNTEESYDGYLRLFPEDTQWVNGVPARVSLQIPFYNPILSAHKVTCPSLIVAAVNDSLIPASMVKSMADRIKNSEYCELDANHFEPYVGDHFEENIGVQIGFLRGCCPVDVG